MGQCLSKSSDLRNSLSPEEVTEPSSPCPQPPGMEVPGASEGSRVASGQDAPVGVIWPPQNGAITEKTQICPKALLCSCPLGEPPALLSS